MDSFTDAPSATTSSSSPTDLLSPSHPRTPAHPQQQSRTNDNASYNMYGNQQHSQNNKDFEGWPDGPVPTNSNQTQHFFSPESPTGFLSPPHHPYPLHPAFGMGHQSMPMFEVIMTIRRLEQEVIQLRQFHANLSAEMTQLRARGGSSSKTDHLEETVLKTIKPGRPLHEGEEPGFDCERNIEAYPELRFFKEGSISAHRTSKRGASTVGRNAPKRGRPKKNEPNPETYEYLENPDGTTVSDRDYAIARGWTCDFLDICKALGIYLPDAWKDVDTRVRHLYYRAIRKILTCTQLCQDNIKAKALMNAVYYDTIVRKRKKLEAAANAGGATGLKGKSVKLEDARYTMHDPANNKRIIHDDDHSVHSGESGSEDGDLSDSDSDAPAMKPQQVPVTKAAGPSSSLTKRVALESLRPSSNTSKKARVTVTQPVSTPSTSTLSTSALSISAPSTTGPTAPFTSGPTREEKGKQRAAQVVFEDNCMSMLSKEPRPDLTILPPERPSRPLPKPRPKGKKLDVPQLVIDTTMGPPGDPVTAPASATSCTSSSSPLDTSSLSATSPISASTPATSAGPVTPVDAPSVPIIPLGVEASTSTSAPASASASNPSTTTTSVVATVGGSTPQAESKPVLLASLQVASGARRGHVRKATGWPPNEEMTGPKWDYARAWHNDHGGTLEAFEEFYAGLDKTAKNRIRAHYNKNRKTAA